MCTKVRAHASRVPAQGYNGTVLAYGQTGSGKTHTMSGGVGHYGVKERGITPRVIDHVFAHVANIKRRLKPGESIHISASAVEIYNEEFRDLSKTRGKDVAANNWDSGKGTKQDLKLQEIPTGQGNRVRAEVAGLHEQECVSVDELMHFFSMCFENRSTGSTNLNATSSRSHALFTINVHRVIVSVGDGVDEHLKARVRTEGIESKLHLVDLAGSERVKRSGVEGKHFKEATKINGGLLALGNVIVALADGSPHIPYRTSKLTRLIQVRLFARGCVQACVCTCSCRPLSVRTSLPSRLFCPAIDAGPCLPSQPRRRVRAGRAAALLRRVEETFGGRCCAGLARRQLDHRAHHVHLAERVGL